MATHFLSLGKWIIRVIIGYQKKNFETANYPNHDKLILQLCYGRTFQFQDLYTPKRVQIPISLLARQQLKKKKHLHFDIRSEQISFCRVIEPIKMQRKEQTPNEDSICGCEQYLHFVINKFGNRQRKRLQKDVAEMENAELNRKRCVFVWLSRTNKIYHTNAQDSVCIRVWMSSALTGSLHITHTQREHICIGLYLRGEFQGKLYQRQPVCNATLTTTSPDKYLLAPSVSGSCCCCFCCCCCCCCGAAICCCWVALLSARIECAALKCSINSARQTAKCKLNAENCLWKLQLETTT